MNKPSRGYSNGPLPFRNTAICAHRRATVPRQREREIMIMKRDAFDRLTPWRAELRDGVREAGCDQAVRGAEGR
jgi:hypothetical protein